LIALQLVLGEPWIAHYVRLAHDAAPERNIEIAVPRVHLKLVNESLNALELTTNLVVVGSSGEPSSDAISIDRVYRAKQFTRWIKRHRPGVPPKTVIEITSVSDIDAAAQFVYRERILPVSTRTNAPIALSLARILAKTKVRPNHVSLSGAVIMALACLLIGTGEFMFQAFAAVLIQIGWTLDLTDGTLARITRQTSKAGQWLDTIVDHSTMFGIPFSIAFGASVATGDLYWVAIGFIGVLSMILMRISILLNSSESTVLNDLESSSEKSFFSKMVRMPFRIVFSLDLLPHVYFLGLISGGSRYLIVVMSILWLIYFLKYSRVQLSSENQ
jgi:phosphatidylglycerophosphate synthase